MDPDCLCAGRPAAVLVPYLGAAEAAQGGGTGIVGLSMIKCGIYRRAMGDDFCSSQLSGLEGFPELRVGIQLRAQDTPVIPLGIGCPRKERVFVFKRHHHLQVGTGPYPEVFGNSKTVYPEKPLGRIPIG